MPFSSFRSDSEDLNKVQQNVTAAVKAVEGGALTGARVSAATAIATTDTKVYHMLGRAPRAYWSCVPTVAATFSQGAASGDPTSYVNVKATAATTAIFVFV